MAKNAAKAAKQALLNAQKVDASIITDECGKIAIRKSPDRKSVGRERVC